jgi:hypothetical protein
MKAGIVYLENDRGQAISHMEGWRKMTAVQRAHSMLSLLGVK